MTDKEYVAQDERKVTWGLTRKVSDNNYGSVEVSIYLTDHAPKSTKNMAKFVQDKSEAAFDTLKAEVWTALDLEFEFTEEGRPKLVKKVPPRPVEPVSPNTQQPLPQPAAPPTPGAGPLTAYAEKPDFCKNCGNREFYDNRMEQDQKMAQGQKIGPDWKCKNPDCTKPGVWRPGSYDYNQARDQGPAATAPPAPAEEPSPL